MTAAVFVRDSLRTAYLQLIADAVDAHLTLPGRIDFYDGVQPAYGGAVTTIQGSITLADPCGTVAGLTLTLTPLVDGVRVDSNTITWARVIDGGGAFVFDGAVTDNAGLGPFKLSNINGTVGGILRLDSGTLGA